VSLNAWNVILYVGSMVVDLGMPALVHHLSESKA
jgi:hypothetical protein